MHNIGIMDRTPSKGAAPFGVMDLPSERSTQGRSICHYDWTTDEQVPRKRSSGTKLEIYRP